MASFLDNPDYVKSQENLLKLNSVLHSRMSIPLGPRGEVIKETVINVAASLTSFMVGLKTQLDIIEEIVFAFSEINDEKFQTAVVNRLKDKVQALKADYDEIQQKAKSNIIVPHEKGLVT